MDGGWTMDRERGRRRCAVYLEHSSREAQPAACPFRYVAMVGQNARHGASCSIAGAGEHQSSRTDESEVLHDGLRRRGFDILYPGSR